MRHVIVVGSGPAAAGCVLRLSKEENTKITMLDIGSRLPDKNFTIATQLKGLDFASWPGDMKNRLYPSKRSQNNRTLPEKLVLGSDYPFSDQGQMQQIRWEGGPRPSLVSSAFGGFSNVWGGQAYPFTKSALQQWPDAGAGMVDAYAEVRQILPIAGVEDGLEEYLPTYGSLMPPPTLAKRSHYILERAQKHRLWLKRHQLTLGTARVGLESPRCVKCGMCNGGCVWGVIFSTQPYLNDLIASHKLEYLSGWRVTKLREEHSRPILLAQSLSGEIREFRADQVYLAAGALGTTQIVFNSRPDLQKANMLETRQVIVPLWFRHAIASPVSGSTFSLGQLGLLLDHDSQQESFLQIYPYDQSFETALPNIIHSRPQVRNRIMAHLAVGLLYLNSEASPMIEIRAEHRDDYAELTLAGCSMGAFDHALRGPMHRLLHAAPKLDMWPMVPMTKPTPAGRSYHWGGQFPFSPHNRGGLTTDRLGRLSSWENVHLVDASTFPVLSPTGFMFTIMANAYRIADESIALRGSGA